MQYARGYQRFPEPVYHMLAVVLAGLGYLLFDQTIYFDWRYTVVKALIGISANVGTIYGGTFLASNAAKAGVAFIPVTDSIKKENP